MVPHGSEVARVRPGDQQPAEDVHRAARNGHRRRTTTDSRDSDRRILCSGGDQGRTYLLLCSAVWDRSPSIQDGTETRKTFLHVPSAIEAEEAEEIGVEHLLRDIKDSTTTTLATRVAEQLASLRGLQSRLSDVQAYLVEVASGKMPLNHQISYHLQDALNLLPDLNDPEVTQSFATTTNDEMLVVYVSSLLRAVIALHALVDNKASIGRAELEEGKGEKEKEKEKTKGKSEEKDKGEKDSSKTSTEDKGL